MPILETTALTRRFSGNGVLGAALSVLVTIGARAYPRVVT